MTRPLADVVDLGRYRERRGVRRAAGYVVIGLALWYAKVRLAEVRELVEGAVKWAAEQFPDEGADATD